MTVREYVALIPEGELRRVRALIRRAVRLRGGWESSEPAKLDGAWGRVLDSARGCGWADAFSPGDLEEARLQRLLSCIDRELLGGALRKELLRRREEMEGTTATPGGCGAAAAAGRSVDENAVEAGGDGHSGGSTGKGRRKGTAVLGFSVDDDDQGENDWWVGTPLGEGAEWMGERNL